MLAESASFRQGLRVWTLNDRCWGGPDSRSLLQAVCSVFKQSRASQRSTTFAASSSGASSLPCPAAAKAASPSRPWARRRSAREHQKDPQGQKEVTLGHRISNGSFSALGGGIASGCIKARASLKASHVIRYSCVSVSVPPTITLKLASKLLLRPDHAWREATCRESNVSAGLTAKARARRGTASRVRPALW